MANYPENNSGNILVVDDEEDIAGLIGIILESQGFTVQQASNGKKALEILKNNIFDLFILDVQMPEMSGFELCKEHLKIDPKTQDTPVLFLSAVYTDTGNVVTGLEMGALDFLSKPFDNQVLIEKVRNLVRLKKMADQLKKTNEKLNQELKLVETLQKKFLHKKLELLDGLEVDGHYKASSYALGDYFEAYPMEDGKQMFLLADVSGHGAVAAVVMAVARAVTLIKLEDQVSGIPAIKSLHDTLRKLVPPNFYLTMFYCRWDPISGKCDYISAGHCPVLFLKRSTLEFVQLNGTCPPVGLGPGIFLEKSIEVEKGDCLFLFTDGITEAKSLDGKEQFGLERLKESLQTHIITSPSDRKKKGEDLENSEYKKNLMEYLRVGLLEDLRIFHGTDDYSDDITTLFIQF